MRLTRLGAVVIAILITCAAVVTFVPGPPRVLAFAVGVLVLLVLFGGGMGSGRSGASDAVRKREVLTREARPRRRR